MVFYFCKIPFSDFFVIKIYLQKKKKEKNKEKEKKKKVKVF